MRIKEIEIQNFRALAGKYTIDLSNSCKNLMVYGENGSGKSSLCQALEIFFNAAAKEVDSTEHKNIFVNANTRNGSYIKLSFKDTTSRRPTPFTLDSTSKKINEQFIAEANKIKGFLDYRQLLATHLIRSERVNLFDLLIEDLLSNAVNPVTSNPVGFDWKQIATKSQKDKRTKEYKSLPDDLENFNNGLTVLLGEIETKANEIIDVFNYNVKIHLNFTSLTTSLKNRNIYLDIDFYDKQNIPKHHIFLNEARLTCIAIAIYLGSILNTPIATQYKILVLDDIFIGLDTSNRVPLLEILKTRFSDFQIVMTTYDRQWYEFVKLCTLDRDWAYLEMYLKEEPENGYEFPLINDNTDFITKAEEYLNEGDLKASAVYIRSAFERELCNFCNKKRVPVRFLINQSKLEIEDLWEPLRDYELKQRDGSGNIITNRLIPEALRDEIQNQRTLVMNPYSHFDITKPQFKTELQLTIDAVKKLKSFLR